MATTYIKHEKINLKASPHFSEKWVQDIIANDPSILGLGKIVLKDKERTQPHAGRLDLLLQDIDTNTRYEVELQLGKTDEAHIIRTIEYWDIERKRYPQYDHVAVLIAEDITSRFLNVISLFNGFIPLIALQIQAIKVNDHISLVFTTVLNRIQLGLIDNDETVAEVTDRVYWEKQASKATVNLADRLLEILQTFDSTLALKYNKPYIGITRNGQPNNFVSFRPKKTWLWLDMKLERSDEVEKKMEEVGLDASSYDNRWGLYSVRLTAEDIAKHRESLQVLMHQAYDEYTR